ncbi:MAG: hypothetical protein QOJ53_1864 [Sphingomonadales bacterium]|jgi:hypothetical protein|nr:hypothetical protein [Sphingomonadales bacterium]MEA3043218.1 hypothetical protein [Sphingomonadales bacterium]MEA3047532.1 hypothetical protein [Sphingomonadales bacterium]
MAKTPMPTAPQWGFIIVGAVIAVGLTLFFGIGGMIGGAIIGVGAALGAIPYQRAVQEHKKRQSGG